MLELKLGQQGMGISSAEEGNAAQEQQHQECSCFLPHQEQSQQRKGLP